MNKKNILLVLLLINTFSIYSREITPYDELQIIGNYISTYYIRYSELPKNFSELEKMPYFTENDIERRIRRIKNNYNLNLKIYTPNEIWVFMENNEEKILNNEEDENSVINMLPKIPNKPNLKDVIKPADKKVGISETQQIGKD